MSKSAWKPPSALTTDGALNLAAPSASPVSTSIPPEASFSARARIPRRIRPCRCRRFSSSRASATSPAYPRQVRPNPFRHGGASTLVWYPPRSTRSMPSLLSHCISRRPSLAIARARSLRARPSLQASILPNSTSSSAPTSVKLMERAVCVARVAEVFFFLALLQDDDALAELRGAVGGDEARDASPDYDHVVLDVRFGHHTSGPDQST